MSQQLRLGAGLDVLDNWADTATGVDITAVFDALFSVVERAVYYRYPVIDDSEKARELVVVVRDDLAIRIRLDDVATFGIVFVGSTGAALDMHRTETSAEA
jgi:hypothetical protein